MANLGQQIQSRILGPSGTDILSQGMKDLYHTLFGAEEDKPKAPFGGVPSISQMPRTQERSGLDVARSYWANLSQEEKLMEFVDLLAPGPAKLGAGVKAVLGAAKGVPLVGAILRKDALKSVGRQFRNLMKLNLEGGIVIPSKKAVKETIQGIRKIPQKELDFVDELNLTMLETQYGSFRQKPIFKGRALEPTSKVPEVSLSVNPRLPSGEGINTVFHEIAGHARIAGSPLLRKVVPGGKVEEGIVRRFGDAIAPFAEQAVREGKKLNPAVVPKMLRASVEESRQFAMLGQTGFHSPPKLDEARKILRGQLPGEMRMFLEESVDGIKRLLKSTKDSGLRERLQRMDKALAPGLRKFVRTEDNAWDMSNFEGMRLAKKGAAPPVEKISYRPAVQMKDGTVLWHPKAQIHSDAITMNTEKVRSGGYSFDTVAKTGGIGPDGNFYSSEFIGDVARETFEGRMLKELTGEDIAKKIGGIRYEGVMEGLPEAGIPNVYQFTALGGASKGGTFSAGSLDLEDVRKALGKQEETWRRVEGGGV